MKSTLSCLLLWLAFFTGEANAGDRVLYDKYQDLRTPGVDASYHFFFSCFADPSTEPLMYCDCEYLISGCKVSGFTYKDQYLPETKISQEAYRKLAEDLQALYDGLPDSEKNPDRPKDGGTLTIDDKKYSVSAAGDLKMRTFITEFLGKNVPVKNWRIIPHTLEGDLASARYVAFSDLLARPGFYDGKRIRIICDAQDNATTGFDVSSSKEDSYDMDRTKMFLLFGMSSYASKEAYENFEEWIPTGRDGSINATLEGTFIANSSRGEGGYAGYIVQFTAISKPTFLDRNRATVFSAGSVAGLGMIIFVTIYLVRSRRGTACRV